MRSRTYWLWVVVLVISVASCLMAVSDRSSGASHALAFLVNRNRVFLEVEAPLSRDLVSIDVRADGKEPRVVRGGAILRKIPAKYGKAEVAVRYGGELVDSFRCFRSNWWHMHDFTLRLSPQGRGIGVTWVAVGPDADGMCVPSKR